MATFYSIWSECIAWLRESNGVKKRVWEEKRLKREKMEDADAYAVGMNPWEQHSGVIKLPRYDYNSPSSLLFSSLLRNSHSDFLITCTISSVNSLTSLHSHSSPSNLPFHFFNSSFHSATKEAISILHKVNTLLLFLYVCFNLQEISFISYVDI